MSTDTNHTTDETFENPRVLDPAATADSQETITSEIQDIHEAYRQEVLAGKKEETQPRIDFA
ncbi:hypothetical protein KZ310_32945, partial [Escherichia coli]|nr:hypothetical protein [Escherichia coli]